MRTEVVVKDLSHDEMALQLERYTRRLSEYPVSVALRAVRRWPSGGEEKHRYWPAWADLEGMLGEEMALHKSRMLLADQSRPSGGAVACVDVALTSRRCMCHGCKTERMRHVRDAADTCGCWVCQRADEWDMTPKPNPAFRGSREGGGEFDWKRVQRRAG